jgi:trk system potassium uptake protein TrkH
MHKTAVAYAVGKLLQVLGLILFVPLLISLYDHHDKRILEIFSQAEVSGFLAAIFTALFFGFFFATAFREGKNLQGAKEGFAIVAIGWVALTFISCIPLSLYLISHPQPGNSGLIFPSFTDAFFEIMSGFTTTGASILSNVEILPDSLLFLRALTHWLGGMGIITLAIAIFPAMGVSGYQMFKSEVAGPTKEKLQPRLTQTASILWGVYVLLTLIQVIFLLAAGMNMLDAICHSFATLATGGFSNKNSSIAAYDSPLIDWIIIIFMYIGGVNFILHFRALRGDAGSYFRNAEFKFHLIIVVLAVLVSTGVLYFGGYAPVIEAQEVFRWNAGSNEDFQKYYVEQSTKLGTFESTLRTAAFQVVSIGTTTGFATADYDLWPDFLRVVLVVMMFFGACAGSTSGGVKLVRILVLGKTVSNELKKMVQPRLVSLIKLDDEVLAEHKVISIAGFFVLFIGLFVTAGSLMTIFIPDIITAYTATIACMSNVGPGLGAVGSVGNYSGIPLTGKWVLAACMLLGRLEIFTVLILLRPKTWKK